MTEYKTLVIKRVSQIAWDNTAYGHLYKPDGGPNWLFGCPSCGEVMFLDHEVSDSLTFHPSIICPLCEAHFWVKDGKVNPC